MYFYTILSFIVCLAWTAQASIVDDALSHTIERRLTPDNSCATGVHVIVGPGWDKGGTTYGTIGYLANNIIKAIPGSNSFCLGPFPHPGKNFVPSTAAVARQLRLYLSFYNSTCPDTEIVVIGTSAGSVASMNALCGASPSPPWREAAGVANLYKIIAAVFYGDETYNAANPFSQGPCTGQAPNGARTNVTACRHLFPYMQSFCYAQDPYCCAGGTKKHLHKMYSGKYDAEATRFVYDIWASQERPKK